MSVQERIRDLLQIWAESVKRGQPIPLPELCKDCPELLPQVEQQAQSLVARARAKQPPTVEETAKPSAMPHEGTLAQPHPPSAMTVSDGYPSELGGYTLTKILGEGGMGRVYLAEDPQLSRKIAIKVMRPDVATNPQARERFLREARATAALEHDHIIAIHQVGTEKNIPFLVMPLLKGEPLDARLKREGTLSLKEAVRVAREMAEGLAHAHEQGLIHRDIKPANVWLEGDRRRVKILDFGLARLVEGDLELTNSGAVMGTPAYMAPEQANGEKVDSHADLFSLGCVIYQMISGERPFSGPTVFAIMAALATHAPTPLAELRPEVPVALSRLVERLLAKKAGERPNITWDVVTALRAIEESLTVQTANLGQAVAPIVEAPVDPWSGIDAEDATQAFEAAPKSSRAEPSTASAPARSKLPFVLGGVALLVVAGLIVALSGGDAKKDEPKAVAEKEKEPAPKVGDTKKTSTKTETLKDPDPDRKAVETLRPYFQKIAVRTQDGAEKVISTGAPLPEEPFRVLRLHDLIQPKIASFVGEVLIPAVTPLQRLEDIHDETKCLDFRVIDPKVFMEWRCRETLLHLNLYLPLTGEMIDVLKQFPRLTSVGFEIGKESERVVPRLRELSLSILKLTGSPGNWREGWEAIGTLPVRELNLAAHTKLNGTERIAGMPALELLRLYVPEIEAAELVVLSKSRTLRYLILSQCRSLPATGFASFADTPTLQTFEVSTKAFKDEHLAQLEGLTQLRKLRLLDSSVTEAGVKKIAEKLPNCDIEWRGGKRTASKDADPDRKAVETLLPFFQKITVRTRGGVERVISAGMQLPEEPFDVLKLEELVVKPKEANFVGEVFIPAVGPLQRLEAIIDSGTHLDCRGIDPKLLLGWRCRETLSNLGLNLPLTAEVIDFLKQFSRLRSVGFEVGKPTEQVVPRLRELPLTSMRLSGAIGDWREEWQTIGELPLRTLLFSSSAKLNGAEKIARMPALELLSMYGPELDAADLVALSKSRTLQTLIIGHSQSLPAMGFASFATTPTLQTITISVKSFGDNHLAQLEGLTQLRMLRLPNTSVTQAGVKKLAEKLPNCTIEWPGGKIEGKKTTSKDDPDRKAVETLRPVFQKILIRTVDGKRIDLNPGDPVPTDSFVVVGFQGVPRPITNEYISNTLFPAIRPLAQLESLMGSSHRIELSRENLQDFKQLACREVLETFDFMIPLSDEWIDLLKTFPKLNSAGFVIGNHAPTTISRIRELKGVTSLTLLNLSNSPSWEAITAMPLTKLSIIDSRTLDTGVCEKIGAMKTLKELKIVGQPARIDSDSLEFLARSGSLLNCHFALTDYSTEGFVQLASMPTLTWMYVQGKSFTDETLLSLRMAKQLRYLNLNYYDHVATSVTPDGAKRFAEANPKCHIVFKGGEIKPK